jgi:2-oxoglutarate ferredoxin oxidoreductase subunit gamma
MRGGESRSDIIISTRSIGYLRVYHPEVVVAFSQDAYDGLVPIMAKGGLCLAENSKVIDNREIGALKLPMEERSRLKLGKSLFANVISLGVLSRYIDFIMPEHFIEAINRIVPEQFRAKDIEAFEEGTGFESW